MARHDTFGRVRPEHLRNLFLLFGLLALLVTPLSAQNSAPSAPLGSISVTGSMRFSSDQIAAFLGMRPGANVSRDDLQAAADHLSRSGLFSKVQYRFATVAGAVKVDYEVADAPEIAVSFDNFPWFSDDELTAAIRQSGVLFDGSAPPAGAILEDICTAITRKLAAQGIQGRVQHLLIASATTGKQVVQFRVTGADVPISALKFPDFLANTDHGLQERLSDIVGKPYSRTTIELFEFEQVRPVYLAHGYLHVKFDRPTAQLDGGPSGHAVSVSAPIETGTAYTWQGVRWTGIPALPSAALDALVNLNPAGPADGMKIEGAWNNIRDAYAKQGFLDAKVEPVAKFEEAQKQVSYDVSIMEGPQYRMGDLKLTGLSPDGGKRIRSSWKIPAGAVFDQSYYEDFLMNGIDAAFRGTAYHYDMIGRFLQQDPATGKVDVLLDFQ